MDILEKLDAEEQRVKDFWDNRRNPKKVNEIKTSVHDVTIIGCIKTETGWYRLGFDEQTKTMKPLEKIQ